MDKFENLKKQAELMVEKNENEIVHDLKVHQIELELQNEELRDTQKNLEDIKNKYIDLYNDAPIGYITIDQSSIILQANKKFSLMIEDEDIIGKSIINFIFEDDKDVFMSRFRSFIKNPLDKSIEIRLKKTNRWVKITGKTTENLLLIIDDIDEQYLTNLKVKQLLEEKELLLKEVHHRIKNNMSTISSLLAIQASMTTNDELITGLEEARNRINSMMIIYNKLFVSKDFIHLKTLEYIDQLLLDISDSNNPNIIIYKKIENFELDSKLIFIIGIIINELVSNSFKHAFQKNKSGVIEVSLIKKNKEAILIISDNGSGKDKNAKEGFGSLLVDNLVSQLRATIDIVSNNGTICTINFPIGDYND